MKKQFKCANPNCKKEYNRDKIKRTLGEESMVYLLGYCSSQCYTKVTMARMEETKNNK